MAAIVLLHAGGRLNHYQPVGFREFVLLEQTFKFGTIAFFIISGFLVGDRLPASDPVGYLRRRANRLLPAWMLWYGVELVYATQRDLLHAGQGALNLRLVLATLRTNSSFVLIDTPLWFVPNFLVALTCVVLLRRWLNDLRLGAALLARKPVLRCQRIYRVAAEPAHRSDLRLCLLPLAGRLVCLAQGQSFYAGLGRCPAGGLRCGPAPLLPAPSLKRRSCRRTTAETV